MKLNQNGQMTIEMLLIAILLLGFVLSISKQFQEKNLLANVVEGPQTYLVGMAENGVWLPADKANAQHPNLLQRKMSLKGHE